MALLMRSKLFLVLLIICFLPVSAAAGTITETQGSSSGLNDPGVIHLYRPEAGSIHSATINDIINGPHGEVIFATTFGLSVYNGSWSTRHINRDNFSMGLMDDYVTALEYDNAGNLWIGFAGGIQVYDGHVYTLIRDQDLLKSLRIKDFQRWNDDMWVSTGNAALHRYNNGTWTWFTPYSRNGPGFYEADSLALDPAADILFAATEKEGLWEVTTTDDTVNFKKIQDPGDPFGLLGHVRRDPLGGVFFYNASQVVHYDPGNGFTPIVSINDISGGGAYAINDVAGSPKGAVYVATDNGIYVWENDRITSHLSAFEGFGTTQGVDTVFYDARDRLWFATHDDVGYYADEKSTESRIAFNKETPTLSPTTGHALVTISPSQTPGEIPQQSSPSILDQIYRFLSGLFPFIPASH